MLLGRRNVTVAAVVEQKGKFLLVEEQQGASSETLFNQPAGHLEPGESIPEGAIREAMEEMADVGPKAIKLIESELPAGFPEVIHVAVRKGILARLGYLKVK